MTFITKSYQNLFGVRSYINAYDNDKKGSITILEREFNI